MTFAAAIWLICLAVMFGFASSETEDKGESFTAFLLCVICSAMATGLLLSQ